MRAKQKIHKNSIVEMFDFSVGFDNLATSIIHPIVSCGIKVLIGFSFRYNKFVS